MQLRPGFAPPWPASRIRSSKGREAYGLFHENPYHPGLQFKQVHPTRPIYSARVGLAHRVLGIRKADAIIWFWIGSHAEYDQLLRNL
jgi:hypothetical protein